MRPPRPTPLFALLLGLLASMPIVAEESQETIMLNKETEMELRRFHSDGGELLLGFPCDQGTGIAEARAGAVLADRQLEVWLADLLGAHFLPIAPSSMRSLEGDEVATLIQHAIDERGDKRIVLTAGGYGAIPALRGARIWQQRHPEDRHLLGAILFFPMLTASEPQPGKPIDYLPIVSTTSLPIVIMQPGNSPNRFWAKGLKRGLEKGGSRVHIEPLPKVRNRFYARNDATAEELAMTRRLPELIESAVIKLKQLEDQP